MSCNHDVGMLRSLSIDRSGEKAALRRRGLVLRSVLSVGVLLIGAASFSFGPKSLLRSQFSSPSRLDASTQPASPVIETNLAVPLSEGLTASGFVVARRKATIAAEVTGKVVKVFVDEGDAVSNGQVVAKLDSVLASTDVALATSRVAAAEAAIEAISADLADAERILSRTQTLAQRNVATDADLTKAQARVGVLQAQLSQSNAQLQTAKLDARRNAELLEKYEIHAPFSGIVVDRSAQPGEMISPLSVGGFTRTGICTIVDMDSIEIEVDVSEAFIGRVHAGGKVIAVLDAYRNWKIEASVMAIVPTANRDKATVKVRIGLDERDRRILPDMAVKVTFVEDN